MKPDDIPQSVWDAADVVGECIHGRHERGWVSWPLCSHSGTPAQEIVARSILAAVEEERARWAPAVVYFDRYCQDEADDIENCVCGQQQHDDAKAFAAIRNRS